VRNGEFPPDAMPHPMRILYVVSLFPCWSETFIVREIHEMLRLGADVRILSLRHASEKMVQSDAAALLDRVIYPAPWWRSLPGIVATVIRHPVRESGDVARMIGGLWRHPAILAKTLAVWWRSLGASAEVGRFAPAHLHAHFATYPSTSAWLLSRRLGRPFSFTAHAHDIFLEDHLLGDKMGEAAFTVVISEFNRRYLRERVAGAESADVRVVHCGVSLAAFPYLEAGRDPRRILAVGRLDEIKGFGHLVDACGLLAAKGLDFTCSIIGSGPLEERLAARIEALGLGGRVLLLGVRKQEEVREALDDAGIFVLPSVVTRSGNRDGIPVALMEAMASGVPVVSTRVSGIPELVEDGVTGLLAAPADAATLAAALERLLGDPALGAQLARRARERVEREFNIQTEPRKLHDAIASLA
jgi:colanic acid/amylovoran biosynthesis glycosyltransferase